VQLINYSTSFSSSPDLWGQQIANVYINPRTPSRSIDIGFLLLAPAGRRSVTPFGCLQKWIIAEANDKHRSDQQLSIDRSPTDFLRLILARSPLHWRRSLFNSWKLRGSSAPCSSRIIVPRLCESTFSDRSISSFLGLQVIPRKVRPAADTASVRPCSKGLQLTSWTS